MVKLFVIVVACLVYSVQGFPKRNNYEAFQFLTRADWGARPPLGVTRQASAAELVIIHHTYIPGVCLTQAQCERDMRSMQNTHMDANGWVDIGYNFAVGGEGSVYEGRGWDTVGAHAAGFNARSVGIVLIGDFVSVLPNAKQLETAKQLITVGVRLGYISPNYKLIGHRQATATECPGDALFREISTWDHFTNEVMG